MNWTKLRSLSEWMLLVVFILGGGAIARAQQESDATDTRAADTQPEGKIVPIGPPGGSTVIMDADEIVNDEEAGIEAPKYWLGVFGGPVSEELRAQLTIPEGEGVLVRHVVPDSPAAEGGLKDFDILLRANGSTLTDIRELTNLVQSAGDSGSEINVDVLRGGKQESIAVKPEPRPARPFGVDPNVAPAAPRPGFAMGGPMPREPEDMLRFFEQQLGQQLDSRNFGRGSAMGGKPWSFFPTPNSMPAGVSVNIEKRGNEPTHITVKKGNDTWEIVGDDPGSLEQLPDDVRPFVEQLLQGGGMMQFTPPQLRPRLKSQLGPRPFDNDAMQQQLQRMEQQLKKMRAMMEHEMQSPPSSPSANDQAQ